MYVCMYVCIEVALHGSAHGIGCPTGSGGGAHQKWVQCPNPQLSVLVRSLKSSNVELGENLDGRLFNYCLRVAANP